MIPKPEQPEDESQVIAYLRNITKQVIQARIDINGAWQISDEEEVDKIASDELDKVTDALVTLLEAWDNIADKVFGEVINKAAIAEAVGTKSALHVWDELAAFAYDSAVRSLGKKIRITMADLTGAGRLKIQGEKSRRSAVILYEQDDYSAIEKYRDAVKDLRKSKEEAELARFSVAGQTLQAWVKIVLTFIIAIAGIIAISPLRGCRQEPEQDPSKATIVEIDKPNVTK